MTLDQHEFMFIYLGVKHLVVTIDDEVYLHRTVSLNLTGVTRFKDLEHFWLFDKQLTLFQILLRLVRLLSSSML